MTDIPKGPVGKPDPQNNDWATKVAQECNEKVKTAHWRNFVDNAGVNGAKTGSTIGGIAGVGVGSPSLVGVVGLGAAGIVVGGLIGYEVGAGGAEAYWFKLGGEEADEASERFKAEVDDCKLQRKLSAQK
jgi:hypothetical protein